MRRAQGGGLEALTPRTTGRGAVGPRFARAVAWAIEVQDPAPPTGTAGPSISHLLGVASLVLDDGGGERDAIAAVLHAASGARGVRRKNVRMRFGKKVARIVVGCREADAPVRGDHDAGGARSWRRRKERTLGVLGDPSTPRPVLRVIAADGLYNARAIVADLRRVGPDAWGRFHAGAADQLWYHRMLAIVLAARHPGLVTDELRATVREMERLAGWWFDAGDSQPGRT